MKDITKECREIQIPENVQVKIEGDRVAVKGSQGELVRVFSHPGVKIEVESGKILVRPAKSKKENIALTGTYTSHIRNMVKGVNEKFTYQMKTVYAHFPVKMGVKGDKVVISNFLGERSDRSAKILSGVEVKISKDETTISGMDIEKVGQTCANIEKATKVKKKDKRVFQDGTYLVRRIK